jgi:hypothetical protein
MHVGMPQPDVRVVCIYTFSNTVLVSFKYHLLGELSSTREVFRRGAAKSFTADSLP